MFKVIGGSKEQNCYCVCHSPFSSRAICDHCKGAVEVAQAHIKAEIRKTLERLKEQQQELIFSNGIRQKAIRLSAIDNEIKSLEER